LKSNVWPPSVARWIEDLQAQAAVEADIETQLSAASTIGTHNKIATGRAYTAANATAGADAAKIRLALGLPATKSIVPVPPKGTPVAVPTTTTAVPPTAARSAPSAAAVPRSSHPPSAAPFDKSMCVYMQNATVYRTKEAYSAEEPITHDTVSYYIGRVSTAMERVDNSLFGIEEYCAPNAGAQSSFAYAVTSVQNTLTNIASQIHDVSYYQTAISDWNSAIRSQLAPIFSNINRYSNGPSVP
jgi:hypothetical protein